MRFINREEEISVIKECKNLSDKKLFSLCVSGLRRIGKTRLILESIRDKDLYFFVNKDKQSESLLKEYEDTLKSRKILTEFEFIKTWDNFFEILFKRYKGIVVFDEFQNFRYIEKSVFGILQKNIDLNENKKGILIIFSGSTIGLIKKIFSDGKEPLYGRLKRKIDLKELSFSHVVKICSELNIRNFKDVITLYAVFGGFPRYYVAIEDEDLKGRTPEEIFEKFFFIENAVFEEEVSTILSLEFGKRRGIYYDVLTAIAQGNTKISKIASNLQKKETTLTRQLSELTNYFNIINVKKQVCGKKTIMNIEHPLMNFWFKFFYKNLSLYKRRDGLLIKKIKGNVNSYVGKRFEKVCEEFLEKNQIFRFDLIGKQWGKVKGAEKGKNTYEIDIVALNEETKEILFAECKWKDKVNPKKIIEELKEKSKYMDWNNDKRKEYYAIFAKSFSKKIKEKNVYLFDLKDLERILKKTV
ncbi:MAG: ATP-binding protein [Nanoarchaeota archaeon]|nr:ATP-binding protein [Nanoarchaeota archaeon]